MVEEVTPEEVREKIEAGDVEVVDIRDEAEFADGHIPGAINIPMNGLPARVAEREWGDDIVVVCPVGQSSIQAARLIQSYDGIDDDASVTSMEGGYAEWDYELERDAAAER